MAVAIRATALTKYGWFTLPKGAVSTSRDATRSCVPLASSSRKARDILKKNREKLHQLAKALLEFETLSGEEVKLVLKGETIHRDDQGGGSKRPEKASSSVPVTGRPKGGQAPGEMEPQPQS